MPTACNCPACHLRRLTAALVLIAVGALLLTHMLAPGFNTTATVAALLVFFGVLGLARRLVPRPANHPAPASVFFPLLVLVVGVLMLLRHSLPSFPLGDWIAHYWPVLLILWGLTRLVEHYTRAPRARGGLSGGEILLVILIVVAGLGFSGAYRFRHSRLASYWGIDVDNWNPFFESYTFSASTRAALPATVAPASVLIRGYRGDINLVAGPAGAIAADVSDTVHADDYAAARARFQSAQPVIRQEGTQWVVLPTGDDGHANIEADLKLALPPSLPVSIQLENGDVTVPQWNAALDLRATHGAITAAHIAGNVTIASGHDSVSLDQVAGNVAISGDGDDIALSNVQGEVTLEGEFAGSLSFRNLARGLRFNSSRTALAIAALPGSLTDDLGEIDISNARAITLRTRDEEIAIRRFSGPLEVHDRNNPIRLASDLAPSDPIVATDRDADIALTLPADSRFHLDADLRNGDLHNDFGDAAHASAPSVSLQTTNGTISVTKQ